MLSTWPRGEILTIETTDKRASHKLFKMLLIKLELVIKRKTRENMKTRAYDLEVKVAQREMSDQTETVSGQKDQRT